MSQLLQFKNWKKCCIFFGILPFWFSVLIFIDMVVYLPLPKITRYHPHSTQYNAKSYLYPHTPKRSTKFIYTPPIEMKVVTPPWNVFGTLPLNLVLFNESDALLISTTMRTSSRKCAFSLIAFSKTSDYRIDNLARCKDDTHRNTSLGKVIPE